MPLYTAYNLRIPCLYTATEVSIRRKNKRDVGIRRIPAYTPQYTPDCVGSRIALTPLVEPNDALDLNLVAVAVNCFFRVHSRRLAKQTKAERCLSL